MKRCSKCGEMKPLDAYYKAAGTRDGLRGDCKDCFKTRAAARYRANPEPVKKRAREWAQANRERVAARARARRALPEVGSLHVDHDPTTGKVRGLLCFSCNNALGDFRDRVGLLHAAVEYLDPPPPELVDAVRARVAQLVASVR